VKAANKKTGDKKMRDFQVWLGANCVYLGVILFLSYIVVAAMVLVLNLNDKEKLFAALTYTSAIYVTLMTLFGCYCIALFIIFAGLVTVLFRKREKYIPWVVWGISIAVALPSFLFFYAEYIAILCAAICLVIMIAASIMRACLKKKLFAESEKPESTEYSAVYAYSCKNGKGMATAGNIFGGLSYVLGVFALHLVLFAGIDFSQGLGVFTFVSLVLAMMFGAIGYLFFKKAKERYYEGKPLTKFLNVWTIICAILVVAVMTLILFLFSMGSSEKQEKKKEPVKVKDKYGREYVLNYGGEYVETCEDGEGGRWKTKDGGKTFVKMGEGTVTDALGRECKIIFDSTVKSGIYKDNFDNSWETTDYGKTFRRVDRWGNIENENSSEEDS
jgi:uncharacterized membrane protein YidH (DUF202 family)